jgi:uncharacterized protein (DUF58 family)
MKIRRAIIVLPLLLLALSLAGGFPWLWRAFVLMVAVLLLSYLWLRISERAIGGRVSKIAGLYRLGDTVEQQFTVTNSSRLPSTWIEVSEQTDLPGYKNEAAFNLPGHGSCAWSVSARCTRRGQYALGNFTVKVSDPLGLFAMEKLLGERHEIIVYPETLELPYFQALPSLELGKSPRRWLASEAGPSAARVRDYTSGDSFHHIHWPTTAHSGKLMVREFEPDRSSYNFRSIWIVPEMNRASRLGEGDDTTEEYAIRVAASLAKKHTEIGKEVGLLAAGDRSYLCLPDTGSHHLHNLLRDLALMKAQGEVPLEALLTSQMDRFEAGSVVLVIMPSGNRNVIAPLRQIRNRGMIVTVVLLDAASFGGAATAEETTRSLLANGLHVYLMRRGTEITRALDSRLNFLQV